MMKKTFSSKANKLYSSQYGKPAIHQTCMRLGLSGLNGKRADYNLIADRSCPNCGHQNEDTVHYFLVCPIYYAPRAVMMTGLSHLLPDQILDLNRNANKQTLSTILLHGSNNFELDTNRKIFKLVHTYITESARFL